MKKLFSLICGLLFISLSFAASSTYTFSYEVSPSGVATVKWGGQYVQTSTGQNTTLNGLQTKYFKYEITNNNYTFVRWELVENGSVKETSTSNPKGFTFSNNTNAKLVRAVFTEKPKYTITAASGGNGTATVNNESSVTVYSGTSVTLRAVANTNYEFDHWNDNTGGAERTVSATANKTYTAYFKLSETKYTINVALATGSTGLGTVKTDNNTASKEVVSGTNVTITATATTGVFKGWSTDISGSSIVSQSSSYAANVTSNITYYAVFAAPKESSISPTGSGSHTVWNTPVSIAGGVDLGLPSGLIWADKNVGAANTGEYGSYFAWGETTAMTSVPEASTYGFKDSQYDSYNTLPAAYDAASVNLGNGWRMPTRAEFQELMDHATWSAGIYRWNVSGNGNTINFPFCGHISTQYPANNTNFGRYWTSDKFAGSGTAKQPYYVDFKSDYTYTIAYNNNYITNTNCYNGYSVRAVHAGATAYTLTIRAKVGDDIVVTNTYRCDYGEKVQITADVPNGYNFVKWADNNSTATTREFTVTANATYNVIYEESVSYVTATFNNWNGSLLEEYTDVESGTTPTYSGSDPTKPADETYTYAFSGWSPELDDITENTTYTAQFTPTYINYSVTFRTSEEDANPAVKSDYHYGDEITNCPAIDPQKIGDETHTYTFLGWYLDNTNTRYETGMTVSGNMVFTARFNEQIIQVVPVTYDVTIGSFAANGKVIITSQDNVREITATGATLTFDAGKSLTIQAVPNAYYHFAGWTEDNDEEAVIDIRTLGSDLTYTPTFAANTPITLEDNHNKDYYTSLYGEHEGDVLTVTLANRQLTEGNWITFCAPFDFTIPAGHPFYGTAYQLQNATMSGTNTSAYISLDFRRTYEIRANVPYLIVPTMTTMSNLEFDGVTIEEAPTVRTTAAQSGQVEFVSVPWQTKITNDATKPNIYLASGNTLRYVSTAGTTFRAFRAYFHRVVNLGAPRRMVISLDGVETTKQLTEDGEVTDTTEKRLENGVLIIERNGVRYDAQGKRL